MPIEEPVSLVALQSIAEGLVARRSLDAAAVVRLAIAELREARDRVELAERRDLDRKVCFDCGLSWYDPENTIPCPRCKASPLPVTAADTAEDRPAAAPVTKLSRPYASVPEMVRDTLDPEFSEAFKGRIAVKLLRRLVSGGRQGFDSCEDPCCEFCRESWEDFDRERHVPDCPWQAAKAFLAGLPKED